MRTTTILFVFPITISATFISPSPPCSNGFITNSNSFSIHDTQQKNHVNRNLNQQYVHPSSPLIAMKARSDNSGDEHDKHQKDKDGKDDSIPTLVDVYTPLLTKRLTKLRAQLLEEQMKKPPNPKLNPVQVITLILQELNESSHSVGGTNINDENENDDENDTSSKSSTSFVLPDSGFRTLIRSSTNGWKRALRKSVGAPNEATEEQLVSALSSAMSRPNNQYQILVCSENDDDNDDKSYHLYFPGDVFEYDEGKAWVETQLRHPKTGKLLAILAWSLIQRESDGAWLVDWLDWQDFRDAFRPGIGREEWSRICG